MKKLKLSKSDEKSLRRTLKVIVITTFAVGMPVMFTVWFPFLLWYIGVVGVGIPHGPIAGLWGFTFKALPAILPSGGFCALFLASFQTDRTKIIQLNLLGVFMIGCGVYAFTTMIRS